MKGNFCNVPNSCSIIVPQISRLLRYRCVGYGKMIPQFSRLLVRVLARDYRTPRAIFGNLLDILVNSESCGNAALYYLLFA